jgi:tetratricopeptide (TPR) repeat protein
MSGSGIWDDDLEARLDQAHAAAEAGDATEARALAEALVAEHFADAPEGEEFVVADAAILLARLRHDAGETESALELLGGVVAHFGRHGVEDHVLTTARARLVAGDLLEESGRSQEAIAAYARAAQALEDPEDAMERRLLCHAFVCEAHALYRSGRSAEADDRCRALVARFEDDDDHEVAEQVAWASRVPLAERAYRLHRKVGRAAEAEAAYRLSIQAGGEHDWLGLGLLLTTVRGRERDAEDALRIALELDDRQTAARAALELGQRLRRQGRDGEARELLELAAAEGDRDTVAGAAMHLGFLDGYAGDRETARRHLLVVFESMGRRWDTGSLTTFDVRLAQWGARLAAGRRSGRLLRRWQITCMDMAARCRQLRNSPPARLYGRLRESP